MYSEGIEYLKLPLLCDTGALQLAIYLFCLLSLFVCLTLIDYLRM